MPPSKDAPSKLKPYLFHGVWLQYDNEDQDAVGTCPMCDKEEHFHVNQGTGQFHCKVCGQDGNTYSFLNWLVEYHATTAEEYEELAEDRGLKVETLKRWGVVKSVLMDEWLVPVYNQDGNLANVYRYTEMDGVMKLLATSGCGHHMFGTKHFDKDKPNVSICEGPWDGMALEEAYGCTRKQGTNLQATANKDACMLADTNVLAVPGCNVFREQWGWYLKNKNVTWLYDNDFPRRSQKGGKLPPAGWAGVENAVTTLARGNYWPIGWQALTWGPNGYTQDYPKGHDVRDLLSGTNGDAPTARSTRVAGLRLLLPMVCPVPEPWLEEANKGQSREERGPSLEPIHCETWQELVAAWKQALQWTPNLNATLCAMMSVAASTKLQGDQLWMRVKGPPGTAKSTLCEAFAVAEEYVYPISLQRGFHSGYTGGGDKKDSSLIPKIDGKTVIIKDGDTLINAPNRDQTLAELRDIYDGTSRATYRNKQEKVYTGLRTTFILAGTQSLQRLNRSYLGDRFLDCVIYSRGHDPELETNILDRAVRGALHRVKSETDGTAETLVDEKTQYAMQLTAGYLAYLRENIETLINQVECSDEMLLRFRQLGEFVSFMRTRPDKELEDEEDEVELPTRLTSQLVRLAMCGAVVMNRTKVDSLVMRLVNKVALDTSSGFTLKVVRHLYKVRYDDVKAMSVALGRGEQSLRTWMTFLRGIGVVTGVKTPNHSGARGRKRHLWQLSPSISKLSNLLLKE